MARVARENVRLQSQLASSEEAVEALKLQARRAAQLRAGAKWQLAAARAASKRMEESGVREDNKKLRGMLESERLSSEEVAAGLQARAEAAERELQQLKAGAVAPSPAEPPRQAVPQDLAGEERASLTAEIARLRGELEQSRASPEATRPTTGTPGTERGAQGDEALRQLQIDVQRERDAWRAERQHYEQRLELAAGAHRELERRLGAADAAAGEAPPRPAGPGPGRGGAGTSFGAPEELHRFSQKVSDRAPGSVGSGFSRFEIEDPKRARDAEEADRCVNRCSNACAIT